MIKLPFLLSQQKTKNSLNHHRVDIYKKNRNIYEMCNALPETGYITGSDFYDIQFAKTKNQGRRQINMHLSAKLTKAFRKYFQAVQNFLSQEIFSWPERSLNLCDLRM